MKRDWEVVRSILLRLEEAKSAQSLINANSFHDHDEQEVAYNILLLNEAGYIEAKILKSFSGDGKINAAIATRLTHKGHDLLDTIRNENIWKKVKETFSTKSLDMTFDLVISVGKKLIESAIS